MLRYLVLGLLRPGGASYGYAIMKTYRDATGVGIALGNVYRELRSLAALGCVRAVPNPAGADPRRVPYEITPRGIEVLDRWLLTPVDVQQPGTVDDLSLRTVLVARAAAVLGSRILAHWQQELLVCRTGLQRELQALEGAATDPAAEPAGAPALLAALARRRLRHVSADLEFVEDVRTATAVSRAA